MPHVRPSSMQRPRAFGFTLSGFTLSAFETVKVTALGLALFAFASGCASDKSASGDDATSTKRATEGPGGSTTAALVGALGDEVPFGYYTVRTFASTEANASVNAFLIYGHREMILVDSALVNSEAEALAAAIHSVTVDGKPVPLTTIWITHGHPDHFMGLNVLTREFPDAKVYARPHTIENMKTSFARYKKLLDKFFPGDVAASMIEPTPYTLPDLKLEGESLPIIDFADGEAEFTSVLTFPKVGIGFVADMAYNDVHPWLNELRGDGVLAHINALRMLPNVDTLYVGHGPPMKKNDLVHYERYVNDFLSVVDESNAPDEIVAKMNQRYPAYKTQAGLRFSAQAFIDQKKNGATAPQ